jgi:Na+-translocating ferredoxin:NAD+ oxidoreductase RnfG subunit
MPSLAASQGIAFSDQEIRSALASVAYPGFTGVVQLEIALSEEAAQFVTFAVIRRQSKKVDEQETAGAVRHVLPDPSRKKPVDKVVSDLKSKLFIRPVLTAVEAHYLDGVLQRVTLQE